MESECSRSKIQTLLADCQIEDLGNKTDIYEIVGHFVNRDNCPYSFAVVNLVELIQQFERWVRLFPDIRPYYAMKCFPDPVIMRVLFKLGCGFDCASQNEIIKAFEVGATPEDIIFANPCKLQSMIRFANTHGVERMTFDSEHELYKIKTCYPKAKLVLRLFVDSTGCLIDLGSKFGCTIEEGKGLMRIAKDLDLDIIGVAFHVGSGCANPIDYSNAIESSKAIFTKGKELGFRMTLLDIGGGYLGRDSEDTSLEMVADYVKAAIKEHFQEYPTLQVIAEPGRFFASTPVTLVSTIVSKKNKIHPITGEKVIQYHTSENLINSFVNVKDKEYTLSLDNTLSYPKRNAKKYKCMIFGSTSHFHDVISHEIMLPDLNVGGRLINTDMGAYSLAMTTGIDGYSGIEKPKLFYFIHD